MERRLFLALPIISALPLVGKDSFRHSCGDGVQDLQRFCRKCHNPECRDAQGPERYLHRLPALLKRVPPGLVLRYLHVSPRVFERMAAEAGRPTEGPQRVGLFFKAWEDQPTFVCQNSNVSDEAVNLHCYEGTGRILPQGRGSKLELLWTDFRGYLTNMEWDHTKDWLVRVEDPVLV